MDLELGMEMEMEMEMKICMGMGMGMGLRCCRASLCSSTGPDAHYLSFLPSLPQAVVVGAVAVAEI
jgi:hypothetical protein